MRHDILWKGRPVETLTREELLEAFIRVFNDYRDLTTPGVIREQAVGKAHLFMSANGERKSAEWAQKMTDTDLQ